MSPAAPVLFAIVIILVVFIVVRERSRRVVVPSEPIEPTDPELLGHSCTIALGDEIVARAGTQTGGEELIVPIESREQRIGTITFRSHRAYDEHDRQFAELLARRVSAAIDNAHRPQEKAPKKKKADEPKPRGLYPDLRRKQILVVDREAASLDFTAELLRQCGARVTIARSATEAILALHQHHDLVVTDNGVQVTEGVMLAQQLRQANGGLPAIVLRKPVDGVELANEIEQALTTRAGAA